MGRQIGSGPHHRRVVVQSVPDSHHEPVRKNQDPYPERARGDSLSPRLLPAGQPEEHGPEDHDQDQPAESDVAGDTAEHVADDDHREDARMMRRAVDR